MTADFPRPPADPAVPRRRPLPGKGWARAELWLAGGLVLVAFSWLPLSYYRMVGWAWILLWQVGALALLAGLWRRLKFVPPAATDPEQWSLRLSGQAFCALGYRLDWVLLGLGIVLALSTLVSPFPRVALWNGSLVVTYGAVLYFYRNVVDCTGLSRLRLWWGLVVVAAGSAVVSLVLWRPDQAMWASENFLTALRNHQPLGHHNFVGGYFVLTLPLAVAAAIAAQGWMRRLWLVTAGLMLATIYVSGSRGATLGLVVWLGATWLSRLSQIKSAHRWRWVLAGVGGALVTGLVLASNPRIRSWFSGVGITDGPTLDRWFMLRLGGNILRDRPLVGVGPGVMSRVSNLYRPIETGAGLDHIQQLHNTPVQIAGELGLVGLGIFLAGMLLLGRLWVRLWRQPLTTTDRALLGGIGGSLLAYGVSSLTDYQLENIPIAGTLLGLVVLLLALGDAYLPAAIPIGTDARRRSRLAVMLGLGLLVTFWLPFNLTVAFDALADRAFYNQQLNLADTRWYKAHRLSPWDPTAAAVASEALWDLNQMLGPSEAQENVRSRLLDYALQAQQAAPNDAWFNHNLAVMHQTDPATALPYAARAVQLMPRHRHYGYWLLGDLLLRQGETKSAIAAFTLEALVNPACLTYPQWQERPYQSIHTDVARATLAEYDTLLAEVDPRDPRLNALYETRALLAWWTAQPAIDVDPNRLRPVVSGLLRADSDPAAAIKAVEHDLRLGQQTPELRLLAAWLDPDRYPASPARPQDAPPDLDTLLMDESLRVQPLRRWLTFMVSNPDRGYRGSLAFAYRNYQAQQITLMLTPQNLQRYTLVAKLNLFPPWPREFPALDRRIEAIRAQALGLPHPTRNGFRLADLDVVDPLPLP